MLQAEYTMPVFMEGLWLYDLPKTLMFAEDDLSSTLLLTYILSYVTGSISTFHFLSRLID